ncbi:unnamed protein product [Strongylus vulgaris]|uniref:Uncharacterized protein n=1 Tax=Strongylus vulgaris TaxID=40348 RepID=A0A3P7LYN6_STRVU|nr:unnamed protein product [Strongylus vulgaris]
MMDLDQGVEGVWMEELKNAPFYSKIASCIVTQLAKAALDSEGAQLDCLLSAIKDQIDKENMNQLSVLLDLLVEKFGEISAEKALLLLGVFRRYVEVWLPDTGSMPKATCEGETVDLLTSKMKAFMLEFDNEKIVKIAVRGLDPPLALKLRVR